MKRKYFIPIWGIYLLEKHKYVNQYDDPFWFKSMQTYLFMLYHLFAFVAIFMIITSVVLSM